MTLDPHRCCESPLSPSEAAPSIRRARGGLWTAGASVMSAAAASACCWLPLLLVTLGLSAAGVSSAFEKVRPYFLGACAVLLGLGFYLVYIRNGKCAPNTACAGVNRRLARLSRGALWIATLAVAAFTFFPHWPALVLSATSSQEAHENRPGPPVVTLRIGGMTCEGCALTVQKGIQAVPGVAGARVLYPKGEARITLDESSTASNEALIAAVHRAGYEATLASEGADSSSSP